MKYVLSTIFLMILVCISLILVLTIPEEKDSSFNFEKINFDQPQEWKEIRMSHNAPDLVNLSLEKMSDRSKDRHRRMVYSEIEKDKGRNVEYISMGSYSTSINTNLAE